MHVFVVGRQSAAGVAAVRAVVQDWSAVGLAGPSVWIDPATAAPGPDGAAGPRGYRVADGLIERVELRSWMPRNPGRVRVVCLQALSESDGWVGEREVYALREVLRLPPETPLVNLLVPAEGTEGVGDGPVFDSQINVLVQPVDATDPAAAIEPLSSRSPTFDMHAAAALCTAGGLWTGMSVGPLDGERPWSGTGVAVGRTFVRRLDATAVLDRLATEIYGAPGTLPAARNQQRDGEAFPVVPPGAQLTAAEASAAAVLYKHAAVTAFAPPPPFAEPPRRKTTFWEAVKLFFTFLGQAVAKAPGAWFNNVMQSAGTSLERRATEFFYGRDSGYEVVVTGLSTTSPPGGQAQALQNAAFGLFGRVAPPGTPEPVTEVPQLWADTVRTVAALADGGDQDPAIPLPGQNSRAVIDNPAVLCARPDDPPFRLPHGAPGSEFGPIAPTDPYHATMVAQILDGQLRTDQYPGGHPGAADRMASLAHLRQQLAGWMGQRRNAMWTIGTGLAAELDKARRAHAELLAAADQDEAGDERAAALAGQRRVRTGILLWLVLLLVAIGTAVALAVFGVLSATAAIVVSVAALLICLVGAFLTFARGQRLLWQAIHRSQVAAKRREWLAGSALQIAQQEYRLASVYGQSQIWAQIVSEHVHAPFGAPTERAEEQGVPARLTGDLPLSVALASADYVPTAHAPVVYHVRSALLGKDWLNVCITRQQRLVIAHDRRMTARDLENRLYTDATLAPGGPLMSYLAGLRSPQIRQQAWDDALTALVDSIHRRGLGQQLLPEVRVDAGAIRSEQSWSAMTEALLAPKDQLSYDGFSSIGITNGSPTVGRTLLATDGSTPVGPPMLALPTAPTSGRHQLDRFIVRWDLTHPVPPEDLTYFGAAAAEPGGPNGPHPIIDVWA
ncbi:hypothetical protein [Nakamurella sp.]|uniref:hypothetical protein n=1 Tax=Nakamurella sp. TaxID=1869182 RepID=UPI003B3AE8F2